MIVLNILNVLIWLWIIPICLGMLPSEMIDKERKYMVLPLVCGYIIEWFVFQVVALPVIFLQEKSTLMNFTFLVWVYAILLLILTLGVVCYYARSKAYKSWSFKKEGIAWGRYGKVFYALFWACLILQVLGLLFLAFADGDDSYYIAVATIAERSDKMYLISAYRGGPEGIDVRHALAPMPIWVAFLSRMTGVHSLVIAHVIFPIVLLLMTYGVYACIGQFLCKDKRDMIPLFLFIVSLLVLFGNYSMKTTETFLLTRTAQGKAILGNVIFPFAIFLLLLLLERVSKKEDTEVMIWVMLIVTSGAGCLCSGLGGVLIIVLYSVAGFYASLIYKRWNIFSRLISCCLPALLCIALYLLVLKI